MVLVKVRNILNSAYEFFSTKKSVFFFSVLTTFVTGAFILVQWYLPIHWERQPNFEVKFYEPEDGLIINNEIIWGNPEQCIISGMVEITNKGTSPVPIQDTILVFIPHEVTHCETTERCVVNQLVPESMIKDGKSILDSLEIQDLKEQYHHLIIPPITNEHDLFAGGKADRVFNVVIPTEQIQNDRLLILAHQVIGSEDCSIDSELSDSSGFGEQCSSSRASVSLPFPCRSLRLRSVEAVDADISRFMAIKKEYEQRGVDTTEFDNRIKGLVNERINIENAAIK